MRKLSIQSITWVYDMKTCSQQWNVDISQNFWTSKLLLLAETTLCKKLYIFKSGPPEPVGRDHPFPLPSHSQWACPWHQPWELNASRSIFFHQKFRILPWKQRIFPWFSFSKSPQLSRMVVNLQLVLLCNNIILCVFSVHLVVHSLKDLPSTLPPGMLIGAVFR